MEKEYFYAPDKEYKTDEFGYPTIIHKISTEDIRHLSLYIVENVEPLSRAITMSEAYVNAFSSYSEENQDYPHYDVFKQLEYGDNSSFLLTNVSLALLEKSFREEEIDDKKIESYKRLLDVYKKQLNYNKQAYGNLYSKSKAK